MKIALFAFGKLKTPGLREAATYYHKLSLSWADLEEYEIKPLAVPDKAPATRLKIQEKEEQILLEKLDKFFGKAPHHFYLLDETGVSHSTQQWSGFFKKLEETSTSPIAFCIGSSLGFSKDLKKRARGLISLGPQTLPHELARIVLMEQIFRACSFLKGHPYHNEG